MTKHINSARRMFFENALWLVGLGLMLASSGIDGAYMSAWMPSGMAWLGYILNTTGDITGMAITYYYGVLVRENAKTSKKHKLAQWLLGAEAVSVFYSWFFSWRQLRHVMQTTEPDGWRWVAPVSAAFTPLLLAFIGLAQSLIVQPAESAPARPQPAVNSDVKNEPAPQPAESTPELDELAMQILELYTANPQITQTAIADAVQVSRPTVKDRLEKLQAAGKLPQEK